MITYDVNFTPDVVSFYRRLITVKPIPKRYRSLFGQVNESTNYDPSLGDRSSPISKDINTPMDNTGNPELLDQWGDEDDTVVFDKSFDELIFHDGEDDEENSLLESTAVPSRHYVSIAPSDQPYGIPRLHLFPLRSRDEVRVALRNESAILDPNDRAELQKKLVEACNSFGIKNEAPIRHKIQVYGISDDNKPETKEDVIKEHLKVNDLFYNNLMYSPEEYLDGLKRSEKLPHEIGQLLNHFYPSFKIHTFVSRSCSSVGGLFEGEAGEKFMDMLGEYGQDPEKHEREVKDYITAHYDKKTNWYKVAYTDIKHIVVCASVKRLISALINAEGIMSDMLDVAYDWETLIHYHYSLMMDAEMYSKEFFIHAQALHDLYWDPLDNPDSQDDCASAKLSFLAVIPDKLVSMNEINSGELIKKEDLATWLKKELDPKVLKDYYLLPSKKEYLILSPSSIKYAMDYIVHIDESDRQEYARNLNRLWWKFRKQCGFKLSIDHPYAKYLGVGKYKIEPEDIVVNILEGVVEDRDFMAEHKKSMPQSYRTVELFSQDAESTVHDLDPDHNKNKVQVEGAEE